MGERTGNKGAPKKFNGKMDVKNLDPNYKIMYNNTLILERFMCMFAINPNTAINQKIVKVPIGLWQNCSPGGTANFVTTDFNPLS